MNPAPIIISAILASGQPVTIKIETKTSPNVIVNTIVKVVDKDKK